MIKFGLLNKGTKKRDLSMKKWDKVIKKYNLCMKNKI